MSLLSIKATFACDGCGRGFIIALDPATPATQTLYDVAVAGIRASFSEGYVGEKRSGPAEDTGICSIQAGKQLCPQCTAKVDHLVPEDREATAADVEKALGNTEGEAEE